MRNVRLDISVALKKVYESPESGADLRSLERARYRMGNNRLSMDRLIDFGVMQPLRVVIFREYSTK